MSSWFRTHRFFHLSGTENVKDREVGLSLFGKFYGSLQRIILQENYLVHQDRVCSAKISASNHCGKHSIPLACEACFSHSSYCSHVKGLGNTLRYTCGNICWFLDLGFSKRKQIIFWLWRDEEKKVDAKSWRL